MGGVKRIEKRELTPKQEGFCQCIVSGKNITEAYRANYSHKNMKAATVHRSAKQLIDNHKIKARIEEIRAPVREALGITLENHLEELRRLRNLASEKEHYAAAITAETNRGKVSGLYVEKVEQTGNITYEIVTGVPRDPDDNTEN